MIFIFLSMIVVVESLPFAGVVNTSVTLVTNGSTVWTPYVNGTHFTYRFSKNVLPFEIKTQLGRISIEPISLNNYIECSSNYFNLSSFLKTTPIQSIYSKQTAIFFCSIQFFSFLNETKFFPFLKISSNLNITNIKFDYLSSSSSQNKISIAKFSYTAPSKPEKAFLDDGQRISCSAGHRFYFFNHKNLISHVETDHVFKQLECIYRIGVFINRLSTPLFLFTSKLLLLFLL